MFKEGFGITKTYIASGYTDLRNGINGLASFIESKYKLSPFEEGTLFLFCGKKADRIKGLLWEGDGFLLLYKRIESGRYIWPRNKEEIISITSDQYKLLMEGFSFVSAINKANYTRYN